MRFFSCLGIIMVLCSAAVAEQIQFKIVDIGWLQHSSRGAGVEIVYQFDRKPDDGDDALRAFALSECNRVAPRYVPMVLENTDQPAANFVAMTFRFGGNFGTYLKFFANYENEACSALE